MGTHAGDRRGLVAGGWAEGSPARTPPGCASLGRRCSAHLAWSPGRRLSVTVWSALKSPVATGQPGLQWVFNDLNSPWPSACSRAPLSPAKANGLRGSPLWGARGPGPPGLRTSPGLPLFGEIGSWTLAARWGWELLWSQPAPVPAPCSSVQGSGGAAGSPRRKRVAAGRAVILAFTPHWGPSRRGGAGSSCDRL